MRTQRPPIFPGFAFTLLELLVVMAVISLLTVLLLPSLTQATTKAKGVRCVSNLRQFGLALQGFADDSGGFPPFQTKIDGEIRTWPWLVENGGFGVTKPATNFHDRGIWTCPAARWTTASSAFVPSSYGYNAIGSKRSGSGTNSFGLFGHATSEPEVFESIRFVEIAVPAEMMTLGDSMSGGIEFLREDPGAFPRYGNGLTRHAGRVSTLFCDSHVESASLRYVFEDTSSAALSRWNRDHLPHVEFLGAP